MLRYYDKGSKHRDFLSSKSKDDYLGYIDKGIKSTDGFSDYIDYAGNPEKSSGVFDSRGLMSPSEKKELRERLRNTDSVIWDMVISTEEKYGKRNLTDWKEAQKLLNDILPKFFKRAGMDKDNVVWYAGLHENTDNRHIHISFFEKEPRIYDKKSKGFRHRKGKIGIQNIRSLKMDAESYFLQPAVALRRMRDEAVARAKATVLGKSPTETNQAMRRIIHELYEEIPKRGHVYYASENMDGVRKKVDQLSDMILSQDGLRDRYFRISTHLAMNDSEMIKSARQHHVDCPNDWLKEKQFRDDIHRRMGNAIITSLIDFRLMESRKRATIKHPKAKTKNHLNSILYTMGKAFEISERASKEAMDLFDEFEYRLAKAEHDRLVESGYVEEDEAEM